MNVKIDDVINNYKVTKVINIGGFCNSYLVTKDGDEYFMKEYNEPRPADSIFNDFYKNQISLIKILNSMGSITERIHDHYILSGYYFQVKEFLKGISLNEYLETHGDITDRKHLSIILCGIIKNLHNAGIVHQDLKPEQVMLVNDDIGKKTLIGYRLILSDFDWSIPEGKLVKIMGTPYFKSPEHYQGKQPDEKSDIFTLGIMIYEFLTGRNPFDFDDTPEDKDIGGRVLSKKIYKNPKELNPEINNEINDILLRCLEIEPKNRPSLDQIQSALLDEIKEKAVFAKRLTISNGSFKYYVHKSMEIDRYMFKTFFKDVCDENGNSVYKYLEPDKLVLHFEKTESGEFYIYAEEGMKNYFLLNDTRIEKTKLPVNAGDKLKLFSTGKKKIIAVFEIN